MTHETPALRASDAERERAVSLLRQHVGSGRLTLEDAYAWGKFARVALDTNDVDARARVHSAEEEAFLAATVAGSGLGVTYDVDLRGAEIPAGKATLRAFVVFGNVDVYIPQAVEVDVGGLTVLGHRRDWGGDRTPPPGAPLVRVRAFGLFATVDIWRVPAELASRGLREVIRTLRGQRRGEIER